MEIRGNKAYFDREFYYTEEYLPTPRCRKLRNAGYVPGRLKQIRKLIK